MEFRASNPGTCTVDMDMASHAFEINTCCFCCWVSVGYSHQPPQKIQRQSRENVAVYLKNWWYIHQCSVNPPPKMRQASPGFWWAMSDPRRWRMDGVSSFFFIADLLHGNLKSTMPFSVLCFYLLAISGLSFSQTQTPAVPMNGRLDRTNTTAESTVKIQKTSEIVAFTAHYQVRKYININNIYSVYIYI